MHLENIATPQEDSTPQSRYASLHRTVERGMASDEVLRELVEICLQLGHTDEAVRVHASMKAGPTREHVGALLARRGLIARSADATIAEDGEAADVEPSIAEHALDAVQFLCQGHMPAVALLTMLAFPVIVGVGGFLTSGGSPWLFAGLAALPGLCVLGVVGAMGRQIFLQSADGEEEAPAIPAPAEMLSAAKRYLADVAIVLGAFVAPSLSLLWFNAPLVSSLPGLVIGMFLTPIALILRQVRGDFGALSPVALLRGIGQTNGYARITATFWLAFAPAAVAFWTSLGHAVWLQIAIVGPLAVLPMFGTARLLGTFTDSNRLRLGLLLQPQLHAPAPAGNKPAGSKQPNKPAVSATKKPTFGQRRKPAQHTPLRTPPPAPSHTPLSAHKHAAPAPAAALGNMHPSLAGKAAPALAPAPAPHAPVKAPAHLPPKPPTLAQKAEQSTPQPGSLARRPQPEDWMVDSKPQGKPAAKIEGRAPQAAKAPAKTTNKPTPAPAPAAKPAPVAKPAPAAKPATPAPAPASKPAAKPAPAKSAAKPAPKIEEPVAPEVDDKGFAGPDLSNIPGATIISAEDRERLGAASRKQ